MGYKMRITPVEDIKDSKGRQEFIKYPWIYRLNFEPIEEYEAKTEEIKQTDTEKLKRYLPRAALLAGAITSASLIAYTTYNSIHKADNFELKSRTTENRPFHSPFQVRNIDEVKVGETYVKFHKGKPQCHILVEGIDKDGHWINVIETFDNGYSREDRISLADHGVIPYDNGRFNRFNYLIPENLEPIEKIITTIWPHESDEQLESYCGGGNGGGGDCGGGPGRAGGH